jgi:hypothetical protein
MHELNFWLGDDFGFLKIAGFSLDELDTQTLLFPEKSLYLQCFANEDF